MQTSANFRAENTIVFSAPILRNVRFKQEIDGQPLVAGPLDVMDLDCNGRVDVSLQKSNDAQQPHAIHIAEPVVGTPGRPGLNRVALLKHHPGSEEVLTQNEIAPNWLLAHQAAVVGRGGIGQTVFLESQPVEVLAPLLKLQNVNYAIDFATNEFLLYRPNNPNAAVPTPAEPPAGVVTTRTGLEFEVLKRGTGQPLRLGDVATVHYTGTLENGTRFDSSRDRGTPFQFRIGDGRVIQGWEEGVEGMKPGEVRRLKIPPMLGYGPNGMPPAIPPNATLIFEVEVVPREDPAKAPPK